MSEGHSLSAVSTVFCLERKPEEINDWPSTPYGRMRKDPSNPKQAS